MRKRVFRSTHHSAHSVGPPPLATTPVSPNVCQNVSRPSSTLKKKTKKVIFGGQKQESYAYLGMQVGEFNMLKRLKRLNYLSSWDPKKSMFDLME